MENAPATRRRRIELGILSALAVFLCAGAMASNAADDRKELLERIRQRMTENLARLPNYTCLETIERTARSAGSRRFTLVDRLRLEVAYEGGKELYAWPGAKTFDERPIDQIVGPGGAIGSGSFGMHARAVFTTDAPVFSWAGEREQSGRKTVRFDFQVPLEKSRYGVQTGAAPVIVPYRGSIDADAETLMPLRLELWVDEPPRELKLSGVHESTEYGQISIGGSDFLLPVASELSMVETTGRESRNKTGFDACRQYAGASTVHFDEVGSDGGGVREAIELPHGLMLDTRIRDTIAHDKAARGDAVYAIVTSDVKKGGRIVVPKGAVITGRITRVDSGAIRSLVYLGIGLRFHTIEFGGRAGDFSGEVAGAGIGTNYHVEHVVRSGEDVVLVQRAEQLAAGMRLLLRTR
jgi:hypothetical protein